MKYLTSILALPLLNFHSMTVVANDVSACLSSVGPTLQIPESGGMEGISGAGRKLHASPSIIGNIATQTNTKKDTLEEVRSRYTGPLVNATDLACIKL